MDLGELKAAGKNVDDDKWGMDRMAIVTTKAEMTLG